MIRPLIGIVVTAVVLFTWGYLFWGLFPFYEWTLESAPNDAAARAALKEHFPKNGAYLVPAFTDDPKSLNAAYEEGPVAFVHMTHVEGRPLFEPSIMWKGFLLNTVVIALIAGILGIAGLPTYLQRVQLCGAIGLAAALLINYGSVVWWQISRPWELYSGLYNLSFFLLAGVILGLFIKPGRRAKERDSAE